MLLNTSTDSYDMTSTDLLQCGRIMYHEKIQMVRNASDGKLAASFNTSFTFSFPTQYWNGSGIGVGMAFTFSPRPTLSTSEQLNRPGYGVCVFDYFDTNVLNNVFAVKFASVEALFDYDPS